MAGIGAQIDLGLGPVVCGGNCFQFVPRAVAHRGVNLQSAGESSIHFGVKAELDRLRAAEIKFPGEAVRSFSIHRIQLISVGAGGHIRENIRILCIVNPHTGTVYGNIVTLDGNTLLRAAEIIFARLEFHVFRNNHTRHRLQHTGIIRHRDINFAARAVHAAGSCDRCHAFAYSRHLSGGVHSSRSRLVRLIGNRLASHYHAELIQNDSAELSGFSLLQNCFIRRKLYFCGDGFRRITFLVKVYL